MNAPIARLFGLCALLFALLVGFTSRWTVFEASSLDDNPDNRRALLEEQRIKRGTIRAADGTLLARSVRIRGGIYTRRYPSADLFSHPVGYSFTDLGRTGLEREYNDDLVGEDSEIGSVVDQLAGRRQEGKDLITNLDAGAQRIALDALAAAPGNGKGAVVALEPRTGRVRVLASRPGYDANRLDERFRQLRRDEDAPLLQRTTQAGYPPGSTFKVVTAAAALDSGRYRPDTTVDGRNDKEISGVPLGNFGGRSFGSIPLTEALTNSVNTVWAEVAEKLGKDTMKRYMERFGFNVEPPIDLPSDQVAPSGEFLGRRLLDVNSRRVDVGRMGIGQDKLRVTPLQMATVAATVANGGVRMEPRIGRRVVDPDGRTTDSIEPREAERVMSGAAASALTSMMAQVVREGTGTAAALQGIEVAGKTGTAEVGDVNQVWFIGFAPVRNPRIAIAVTVERSPGQGGTVAAPIAKRVMESLLSR